MCSSAGVCDFQGRKPCRPAFLAIDSYWITARPENRWCVPHVNRPQCNSLSNGCGLRSLSQRWSTNTADMFWSNVPGSRWVGPNSSSTSVKGRMMVRPGLRLSWAQGFQDSQMLNTTELWTRWNELNSFWTYDSSYFAQQASECQIWFTAPGSETSSWHSER